MSYLEIEQRTLDAMHPEIDEIEAENKKLEERVNRYKLEYTKLLKRKNAETSKREILEDENDDLKKELNKLGY